MAVLLVSAFIIMPKESSNFTTELNSTSRNTTDITPIVSPTPYGESDPTSTPYNGEQTGGEHRPFNIVPVLPEPTPFGPVSASNVTDSTAWRAVAKNAWQYFDPGIGVDPNTGLPGATIGFPFFTDWDLGVYLQAVIDAQRIGLISKNGAWGSTDRIEKILTFLETRQLAEGNLPYWWYEAGTAGMWLDGCLQAEGTVNVADTGRLLVALKNLKKYDFTLTERVNNLVYQRMNYSPMWSNITMLVDRADIYDYPVARGFASFWPDKFSHVPDQILSNIYTAPKVETYGVKLPKAKISCEPMFISIFDFQKQDERLLNLSKQVYLAHEARYNETGRFGAFSEGNSGYGQFIYEWVVLPDGRTWVVQNVYGQDWGISPVIYTKIAFSFLSVYKTQYARDMVVAIEKALAQPTSMYNDGIDDAVPDDIRITSEVGSNTNGLILSAARYSIVKNP